MNSASGQVSLQIGFPSCLQDLKPLSPGLGGCAGQIRTAAKKRRFYLLKVKQFVY
jgi:hypothetical protein